MCDPTWALTALFSVDITFSLAHIAFSLRVCNEAVLNHNLEKSISSILSIWIIWGVPTLEKTFWKNFRIKLICVCNIFCCFGCWISSLACWTHTLINQNHHQIANVFEASHVYVHMLDHVKELSTYLSRCRETGHGCRRLLCSRCRGRGHAGRREGSVCRCRTVIRAHTSLSHTTSHSYILERTYKVLRNNLYTVYSRYVVNCLQVECLCSKSIYKWRL